MDRMTIVVTAVVLAFCAGVMVWLRFDHLDKVAEVKACEKRGGTAVIAARQRYACITVGAQIAP